MLVIVAHHLRKEYPGFDEGDYVSKTQDIYLIFKTQGLIKGLSALYWNRLWKPTMQPLFLLPFLILTSGKVLSAVFLANFFIFGAFLFGAYKLNRLYLEETESFLSTLFLGTFPFLLIKTYTYNTELTTITFLTLSLYSLYASEGFKKTKHSILFGVFLFFATATRPVEALLCMFFPLLFEFIRSLREKKIPYRGILLAAASFILPTVGWFFSFIPNLINWCWGCSFGQFALDSSSKGGLSRLQFAKDIYISYISYVFWILISLFLFMNFYLNKKDNPPVPQKLALFLLASFLAATVHLISGTLSFNADTRYYSMTFFAPYLALTILALRGGKKMRIAKLSTLVFCIACNNVINLENLAQFNFDKTGIARLIADHARSDDPIIRESPASRLVTAVQKEVLSQNNNAQRKLAIAVYNLLKQSPNNGVADQFLLKVIVRETGAPLEFNNPFLSGDEKKDWEYLSNNFDYLMIGPCEGDEYQNPTSYSDHFMFKKIYTAWTTHQLATWGLSYKSLIKIKFQTLESTFLLLQFKKG